MIHPSDYADAAIASCSKLTLAQQAVFRKLARYVNRDTGVTFVSMATVARECHVNVRQVSDHVHALATAGVLRLSDRVNGRSQLIEFPIHDTTTGYPQPLRISTGVTPVEIRRGCDSDPCGNPHRTPVELHTDPCGNGPTNSYDPVSNSAPLTSTDGIPAWFVDKVTKRLGTDVNHPSLADDVMSREAFVTAKRKAAGK